MITKHHHDNEEDWLAFRGSGEHVPASDIPAMLGISRFKTSLKLWAQMRGEVEWDDTTEAMALGHYMEPYIAGKYTESTGDRLIDTGAYTIFKCDDFPFISATPDRERECGHYVQIKNVGAHMQDDWDDGVPLGVEAQVQAEMAATGKEWEDLAAYFMGSYQLLIVRINRNDGFIERMHRKCENFLEMIHNNIRPDAIDADTDVVAKLIGKADADRTVDFPEAMVELIDQLETAKYEIKGWTRLKDEASNRIKMAMGSATVAGIPGGGTYTLRADKNGKRTLRRSN